MPDRLNVGHIIAFLAAVALMLFTAMDWYSTRLGEEARRLEETAQPSDADPNQVQRQAEESARNVAEGQERNAWQADGAIDRVILVVVVAAALLSLITVLLATAGRPDESLGMTALVVSVVGSLLLTYRILQEPGLDSITTVEPGAPLALVALGVLALGGSIALRDHPRAEPDAEPEGPERQPA